MTTKKITSRDVWIRVKELGEKISPDMVNKADGACMYAGSKVTYDGNGNAKYEGQPCIVGQAMLDLGISRSDIEGIPQSIGPRGAFRFLGIGVDSEGADEFIDLCGEVQELQDLGVPWGVAVAGAIEECGLS